MRKQFSRVAVWTAAQQTLLLLGVNDTSVLALSHDAAQSVKAAKQLSRLA